MAVNRKPIDYAADRTRANGRSIYEIYAVPKQREPQDDSP